MAPRHSKNPTDATTDRRQTAEAMFSVAADLAAEGEDVSMIVDDALELVEEGDR